ncbi:MAG: DUF488 domain-containing protein [Scytonema sp. PMC 1070.18]|nr:DUF488 domain-containing protein [Scytonema sp. PMC 1070.18]
MSTKNICNQCILTFGYGNRKNYDIFLEYLKDFDIKYVVDVRTTPRAWSRQWYGERIKSLCESKNVQYVSKTSLGNTSGNKNWVPANKEAATKDLQEVAEFAQKGNILILCAELDANRCHRTEVASCLEQITSIPVKHLE